MKKNNWLPCKKTCELGEKSAVDGRDPRVTSSEKKFSKEGYGGIYCGDCLQIKALRNLAARQLPPKDQQ